MGIEPRATEAAPTRYRPRRPSRSVLYRCVQQHLETWLAQCREGHDDDGPVPPYVEREFRRYLECGVLAHGFARARCGDCGHDFLIAFSCKGCGVCAHSPGSGPAARLGAVAFIHRFGSTLNAHLHFHCVVIDDRRKSPGGTACSTPPPRAGSSSVPRQRARATRATRKNTPTATHNHSVSPSTRPRQPVIRCHSRHLMRLDFRRMTSPQA
jgi:hypothetical protein